MVGGQTGKEDPNWEQGLESLASKVSTVRLSSKMEEGIESEQA